MIEAVIFDWGGTLTPWHSIDFHSEAEALAMAAVDGHPEAHLALHAANQAVWTRSKESQTSATLADVFTHAGLTHEESRLSAYQEFWEPHTVTDPDVPVVFAGLRDRGIRVGVLSNTIWTREFHEAVFARDGVLHLVDGAVYTSEIEHAKPHPEAFRAALDAVGVPDPARAVYVGDRPYEDVHGAQRVGMRAVLVPHSDIPADQQVPVDVEPDAVVQRLADLLDVIDSWS